MTTATMNEQNEECEKEGENNLSLWKGRGGGEHLKRTEKK
jgi:hypothetical protein